MLNLEYAAYLRYLSYQGAVERYGVDPDVFECDEYESGDNIRDRIDQELHVIEAAGYPGYFLIVADLMRWCREQGIPTGPGRGSVCGSAVAYATGITDVDPLRWGIPFERFLHLERIAMPDVDLDVCQSRRHAVIEYLRDTYGRDNVAQIITYGTLMARGVVRDVWRILHVEDHTGIKAEQVIAMIPEGGGADQVNLTEYLSTDEGRDLAALLQDLTVPYQTRRVSVKDHILRLEGIRRHSSVHAAGVVIADRPLIDLVPLYRKNKTADVQIQYDMIDAEDVGLLKFDVLGLRTITVIGDAEALVQAHTPDFRIKDVSLGDGVTYRLLSGGNTGGVFQLEGEGITGAVKGIRPDRFEDLVALLALYRPGPMEQIGSYIRRKHGEEEIEFAHPDLESILGTTYGLIVYQEQIMGIARAMAGYTAGQADMFRKAIGKKLPELIRSEIASFKEAALERGYDEDLLKEIGDQIAYFGRYGFNLGHATGYAYLTYWTAYLKANHPVEFYAALLQSHSDDATKLGQVLRDAKKAGVPILPPDINTSGRGFTVDGGGIRFGLSAIRGLGDAATLDIIEERDHDHKNAYSSRAMLKVRDDGTEYNGREKITERVPNEPRPYADLWDFCHRLPHIPVNVKQALVVSGAFGTDSANRRVLHAVLPDLNKRAKTGKPFPWDNDAYWSDTMSDLELMRAEREIVGFYVTGHPLQVYDDLLEMYGAYTHGDFETLPGSCSIAGLVVAVREHQAKNGKMAWIKLENEIPDMPDVTVFASNWSALQPRMEKDSVIVVRGVRDNHPRFGLGFKAENVVVLNRSRISAHIARVTLPEDADESDIDLLASFDGESRTVWQVVVGGAFMTTRLGMPLSGALLSDLAEMGWRVELDPVGEPDTEVWSGNSRTGRKAIWEDTLVAYAMEHLQGSLL